MDALLRIAREIACRLMAMEPWIAPEGKKRRRVRQGAIAGVVLDSAVEFKSNIKPC
jgi:hypothetical protein